MSSTTEHRRLFPKWRRGFAVFTAVLVLLLLSARPASAQTNLGTSTVGELFIQFLNSTTITVQAGSTLPPGLSLRQDVPPFYPPTATWGLFGLATTPGNYAFTLLRDGTPFSYTLKITALSIQNVWNLPDAHTTTSYSHQLSASNAVNTPTWSFDATTFPTGLTLTPTGQLMGTPPLQAGAYHPKISVFDGVDTVTRTFNLNVYALDILGDPSLPNVTQNKPYSTTVQAIGGAGGYTYTSNGLPSGLSLSPSGLLSGTTTSGATHWTFDLTATDSSNVSVTKRMSLFVLTEPGTMPSLIPDGPGLLDDCALGVPCTNAIYLQNGGKKAVTWTVNPNQLPAGMSVQTTSEFTEWWIGPENLEISGTPVQQGLFPITFTATDADGAKVTNTFVLKVGSINNWSYLPNGTLNQAYSHRFVITGGRLPYTMQLVGGKLPLGMSLDGNTLTVSGPPTENGDFHGEFEVTDADGLKRFFNSYFFIGGGASTMEISTFWDLGTTTAGNLFSRTLSACCAPTQTWSFASGTLPPNINIAANGVLSGTPPVGTAGTFLFVLKAADASNPANAGFQQFKLHVSGISVTATNLPLGNVGTAYNGSLTASGGTGTLTWAATPERGNYMPPGLTINANGTITGTPTGGGRFTFTHRVTDTNGNYLLRTTTIDILQAGQNPPLNLPISFDQNATVGQFTLALAATGGAGGYSYSLTPGATPVPGMRIQTGAPLPTNFAAGTTGGFLGVITPGDWQTSIRVTDSSFAFFDRVFNMHVSPLRVLSNTTLPKATINQPYGFDLEPYGAAGYSWSATNLPSGVSISPTTGRLFGTPTQAGSFAITINLTDLVTGTTRGTGMTLVVDPFPIVTPGLLPAGVTGTAYSQQLSAPGCVGTCTWSVQSGSTPTGTTLSATGLLSGNNPSAVNATGSFTAQVVGTNGTVQKVFFARIAANTPQPLTINTTAFNDTTVGASVSNILSVQGGTAPYTWSVISGSLPDGVLLKTPGDAYGSGLQPGLAFLGGRPMVVGSYTFTLQVSDGVAAVASRQFTWLVSPIASSYNTLPLVTGTLIYNTPYNQALLFMGGTNSYTFSAINMPPGLSVNPSTGAVSGTATNTGAFTATVTAVDGGNKSLSQNIAFTVNSSVGLSLGFSQNANLGTVALGSNPNRSLTPSGGTAPYTVTALTPLPPGLVLQPISTNPAGSVALAGVTTTPGSYSFTIQEQDSVGNVGVRTFTLIVTSFTLLNTQLPDASVGVPYSHTLAPLGAATTFSLTGGVPPGISISPAGVFSGTPQAAGNFSFSLVQADGPNSLSGTVSMRVSNLRITSPAQLPFGTQGKSYNAQLTATGGAGPLSWTIGSLPFGLNQGSDGSIFGTPLSTGTANMLVTVTDGGIPVSKRMSIFVRQDGSTVGNGLFDITLTDAVVGEVYSSTVGPAGGFAPFTLSVASGALPPGMSLVSGATLPANAAPGTTQLAGVPTTPGSYTFALKSVDAQGGEATVTYHLKVGLLRIIGGNISGTINQPLSAQFLGIGGGPYTFTALPTSNLQDMLPPGVTISPTGLMAGTPLSTGLYRFNLQMDSGGQSYTRQFTLTIASASGLVANNANSLNPPMMSVGVGRSFLQLDASPANGSFPSQYAWSVVGGALPAGTSLEETDGLGVGEATIIGGRPLVTGDFTVTLRATNKSNAADFADHQFKISVSPMQLIGPRRIHVPDDVTNIQTRSIGDEAIGRVGVAFTHTLHVAGGTGPYTFAYADPAFIPNGLSLSTGGVISGTPTQVGLAGIPILVTDSLGKQLRTSMGIVIGPATGKQPLVSYGRQIPIMASVGVPFAEELDRGLLLVPNKPVTWSVDPQTPLPDGVVLYPDGNGVAAYLGGKPTTPGFFEFNLIATDPSSQSITIEMAMFISPIAVRPNGDIRETITGLKVGNAATVNFVPSGGFGPYVFELAPMSDLVPGMTFNANGSMTGTPSAPGNFLMTLMVFDAAQNDFYPSFRVVVDNAAGEAPAVDLTPKPISLVYEIGQTVPSANVIVNSFASAGTLLPYTLKFSGIPGISLSQTSGTASGTSSTPVPLSVDAASFQAGSYDAIVAAFGTGISNRSDWTPVQLTVLPARACDATELTSSGSVQSASAKVGLNFSFIAGPQCAWTAGVSDPSWITVTDGASGSGSGKVTFSLAANTDPIQRVGTIIVLGEVYTITQFGTGCSLALSPAGLNGVSALGGVANVTVNASSPLCAWTASGLSANPSSGSGTSIVQITIPPNPDPTTRFLNATIAGQTFSVQQIGAACVTTLDAPSGFSGAGGGTGSVGVSVVAGCGYDTTSTANWLIVQSGGSGNASGTLVYNTLQNTTTSSRNATLIIGGAAYQVTQAGLACSITIDASGLPSAFASGGGSASIVVTTNAPTCSWNASSDAFWASLAPLNSTGSGSVIVSAQNNASTSQRSANLTIGGQSVSIGQYGTACTYQLQATSGSVPAAGGNGSVGVTSPAACSWGASPNAPWLHITAAGGLGSSQVAFLADSNPSGVERTGTLTVASVTYWVLQAPAPCTYNLSLPSTTVASGGTSNESFTFTSPVNQCQTVVKSYSDWIQISTQLNGVNGVFDNGSGTVTYSVSANPASTSRVGRIQVGDALYTITELGGQCSFSLDTYGVLFGKLGGSSILLASQSALGCPETHGTDMPSFIILGSVTGPVSNIFSLPYTVNPWAPPFSLPPVTPTVRIGHVTFSGKVLTVKQKSY